MPFISTKENGGVPDKNVNRRGRPLKGDEKTLTRREAKDKEHLSTVRKLKPLKHSVLKMWQRMLDDPKTSEAGRLKISEMIMKYDTNILESLYAASAKDEIPEEDTSVQEVQPQQQQPILSLRIVEQPKQE